MREDTAAEGDHASTLADLEDRLLGGPRELSLVELAERAGGDVDEVRLYWHALGLPTRGDDERAYTATDADVLRELLGAAHRFQLSARTAVSLVRSVGHTTDRLVLWQVEALVEQVAERYGLDDVSARLTVLDRLADLSPVLERQLVHAWRRQLAAIARRFDEELSGARDPGAGGDELPLARAVGFADVVGFTRRTADLGPHELADFVQGFEAQARDVVTAAGGRVVKTIGDAILFVADDVARGSAVALGLAETFGTHAATPVRVSLVWGRVLSRFGDVFGPSVNLAARLTDVADPGTVLVDAATAALLAAHLPTGEKGAVTTGDVVERVLPSLGPVGTVTLSPRAAGPEVPGPRAG